MTLNLNRLFLSLPLTLKKQAINYAGLMENRRRYGSLFEAYKRDFHDKKDQRVTRAHKDILKAARHHPYYRDFSINNFGDIPIITKTEIQENHDKFLIDKASVYRNTTTSGTSGERFEFSISRAMLQKEYACAWFFRELHGLHRYERQANFFGRSIFSPAKDKPPFWLFSRPTHQLLFSELHLTSERAPLYLKALKRYRVRWFHGFPSFVSLLAGYLADHDLTDQARALNLKGITLSSENLLDHQRAIIERVFGCKVFNFYSQGEGVATIYQDTDDLLKVNEHYSFVEFIPNGDGLYRIVGTQLDNQCMPFIRYDTGDLAELVPGTLENGAPVIKNIMGRKNEFLVLNDGRKVGRLGHILKMTPNIREAQIVQNTPGKALFKINPALNFSGADRLSLEYEIKRKLGEDFKFEIQLVNVIERTNSGKLKLVDSSLL